MATHTVTPTPRVLILGHSFIRRLQKFMEHHIGYLDLSLQITATDDIAWHGIGGRTVAKTFKFNVHVVRSTRLDIGVRAGGGGPRGAVAPQNFGQLRFFGQREQIWAKPVLKDVSMFI